MHFHSALVIKRPSFTQHSERSERSGWHQTLGVVLYVVASKINVGDLKSTRNIDQSLFEM